MNQKQRLKELRQNLRLSQREFAEYFGINRRTLQEWELSNGQEPPKWIIDLLVKVTDYESKGEQLSIFKKINCTEYAYRLTVEREFSKMEKWFNTLEEAINQEEFWKDQESTKSTKIDEFSKTMV